MKLKNQIGVLLVYIISCIQTYNIIYYKGCQWEEKDPLINKNIWNEDLCHPIGISSSNYLYSVLVCKSLVCKDEIVTEDDESLNASLETFGLYSV